MRSASLVELVGLVEVVVVRFGTQAVGIIKTRIRARIRRLKAILRLISHLQSVIVVIILHYATFVNSSDNF